MTGTEAYACKRQLFAFLAGQAGQVDSGLPLAGVQIAYAWPGRTGLTECVYGGGVRFRRVSAGDDGHGELWLETTTVGVYVRVARKGADVADIDARAADIGAVIETLLQEQRRLVGNYDYVQVTGGTGDYSQNDDGPVVILAYQLEFSYYLD